MSSADFGGSAAEPMVGEVTALRSFRVSDDGYLLPLTDAGSYEPMPSGTATARCGRGRSHVAPDPECTCGFYAYGNRRWVQTEGLYAWSQLVLGAVHCSGRLVAGEKGVRAQQIALAGCYVNRHMPRDVLGRLREHYPQVEFFTSRRALLAAYPETPLSTYLAPNASGSPRRALPMLSVLLGSLMGCLMVLAVLTAVLTAPEGFRVGSWIAVLVTVSAFVPFAFDAFTTATVGMDADTWMRLRLSPQVPWRNKPPSRVVPLPIARAVAAFAGTALILTFREATPFWPFGWHSLTLVVCIAVTVALLVPLVWNTLPLRSRFPLVPRSQAAHEFAARVAPAPAHTTRAGHPSRRFFTPHSAVELWDMGGYGVGMVHFDCVSDPSDYAPAQDSARDLVARVRDLAGELGLPRKQWVMFIAAERDRLRVLTPDATVSVPVPLAEIDAALPLPTRAWCYPSVRAAYVRGLFNATLDPAQAPFELPSGYRAVRDAPGGFEDPKIAAGVAVARRLADQDAYRSFKSTQAVLPEGLEAAASPVLPPNVGPVPADAQEQVFSALLALLDARFVPESGWALALAITELLDGIRALRGTVDDMLRVEQVSSALLAGSCVRSARGAHLLMSGSLSADVVASMVREGPGWPRYVVMTKDRHFHALRVSPLMSEAGGEDDVDALKDAEQ